MILGKCSTSDPMKRTETKFRLLIIATSGACRAGGELILSFLFPFKFYIVGEA